MPILRNAKKALRSSERKTAVNKLIKSKLKTAVDAAKAQPALETLSGAFSAVDKAVKRHLMPANRAARVKSQLSKLVK